MANNIKSKEIIEGFKDDFFNIVHEYSQSSTDLKLVKFFKFWNDNHLDYLFANRFDPRELSEAIIKMNQLLVEVAVSNTTTQRIVALYFILCLFVKQPQGFRRVVRLTCDDATCIQKFVEDNQQSCSDLEFVWIELRGAIELVEERQLYGPSLLSKRGSLISKQIVDTNESAKFIEKIEPLLDEINQIMLPYQDMKKNLKLDEIDPSVEFETNNSLEDNITHAKSLTCGYRHSLSKE